MGTGRYGSGAVRRSVRARRARSDRLAKIPLYLASVALCLASITIIDDPVRIEVRELGLFGLAAILAIRWRLLTRIPTWLVAIQVGILGAYLLGVLNYLFFGPDGSAVDLRSSGWRPLLQLYPPLLFLMAILVGYGLGRSPTGVLRAVVRTIVNFGLFVAIYALARFVLRIAGLTVLPALNNAAYSAAADRASFRVGLMVVPREGGTFGEPKGHAWFMMFCISLALFNYATGGSGRRRAQISVSIFVASALVTFSTGLVFYGITAMVWLLAIGRTGSQTARRRRRLAQAAIRGRRLALAALALLLLVATAAVMAPRSEGGLPSKLLEERFSAPGRYEHVDTSYGLAARYFLENPIAGRGLGAYSLLARRDTNAMLLGGNYPGLYMSSLVELGLVGSSLLFISIGSGLRRAARTALTGMPGGLYTTMLLAAWTVRCLEIGGLDIEAGLVLGIALAIPERRHMQNSDAGDLPHCPKRLRGSCA